MTAEFVPVWLDWAENRGPVLYLPIHLPPITSGAGLIVLDMGGGCYAVESHSEPGRWHRVTVEERFGRVGIACGCRHEHGSSHGRLCAHAAAALRRHIAEYGDEMEMRF